MGCALSRTVSGRKPEPRRRGRAGRTGACRDPAGGHRAESDVAPGLGAQSQGGRGDSAGAPGPGYAGAPRCGPAADCLGDDRSQRRRWRCTPGSGSSSPSKQPPFCWCNLQICLPDSCMSIWMPSSWRSAGSTIRSSEHRAAGCGRTPGPAWRRSVGLTCGAPLRHPCRHADCRGRPAVSSGHILPGLFRSLPRRVLRGTGSCWRTSPPLW